MYGLDLKGCMAIHFIKIMTGAENNLQRLLPSRHKLRLADNKHISPRRRLRLVRIVAMLNQCSNDKLFV